MTAHTAEARPPLKATALAMLIPIAVTGPLAVWAGYTEPDRLRQPVLWAAAAGVLVLCATLVVAVRARWTVRALRERIATFEVESDRYADETVPALLARLRAGDSAQTALEALPLPPKGAVRRALTAVAGELGRSEAMRAAAVAACANASGRMQALATGMLADLREMEHRHSDPDVLSDLLHLDHRTAQAGRLADSIAVLTGARSGRRWAKPIVMESILRGAMGRIGGYQRVRLHSTSEVAVAGHAAEGVMHALAELMDNAANFSPPTAEVHVYVEEVPAGVVITVEDSGLVMSEVALRRAERAVAADATDLAGLSGTRLGLAVVGRLARKHGLSVSFRPSARGGTGALMMIPQELLTRPRSGPAPVPPTLHAPAAAPLPAPAPEIPAAPAAPSAPEAAPVAGERAAHGRAATAGHPGADEHEAAGRVPAARDHSRAGAPPAAAPGADTADGADARGPFPHLEGVEYGESGLPKRRRGRTLAAAESAQVNTPRRAARTPRSDAAASAARFSTFRQALRGDTPASGTPAATTGTPTTTTGPMAPPPATSTPTPESDPR